MRHPSSKQLLTWLWLLAAALSLLACVIAYYHKGEVNLVPVIVTLLLATVGISSAYRNAGGAKGDATEQEAKSDQSRKENEPL